MLSRGETAYVRGDLAGARDFRVFRELKPLVDPMTREVLGYEGRYVGTAEHVARGDTVLASTGPGVIVPDTFKITSTRLEAGVGDRLSPVPQQELVAYVPHAPAAPVDGRIVSIYGDGIRAGQNHVVAINKGEKVAMRLPDERHGMLFVFRAFDRVSYALILTVQEPVQAGDRFTQP
jgi:hypothetical protein